MARIIISLLVFLGVSFAGSYVVFLFESSWKQELELHLDQVTNDQASAIERRLSRSLSSTYLLSLQVSLKQGEVSGFERFAAETIEAIGGISNLQLAPDGVIQHIYPLAGNEKAIGHNLLKDDKRRKEAMQAVAERKLTLAGPFELVQGGVAVIGRNPVFIEVDGSDKFWGFASALIFLDDLLEVTDLKQLEKEGYQYELSRQHPDSKAWEVFARSKAALGDISVSFPINVPNSQWILKLSRPLPARPLNVSEGIALSFVIGALMALLLAYILREPERLRLVVQEKTRQLNELAFYDVLTGLVNRRLFMEQLEQEVNMLQRTGKKAALMYLDLDDFKKVNDTLGHHSGDELLIEIANRLRATMRKTDIICRLGGDEYAVLMMDIQNIQNCQHIAEKLIDNISREMVIEGTPLKVGISIGVTIIPDDSTVIREMLNNADMALYEAKKTGKNRISFFDQKLQHLAAEKIRLEHELRVALEKDQLELYYQPIIRLSDNNIVMLEVLLRWNHPDEGMIPPDKFIAIAEQCGLIIQLGDWVLEHACRQLKYSLDNGESVFPVAINVSPKQLTNHQFADKAIACMNKHGINPAMVDMEITESLLMENIDIALNQLNKLQQVGCRFSIDDFGTGYSSLAQLKQLPVETIKIDRSFVRDIEHDHHDRQIVEAIIAMSHRLGLNVVAEGVEGQYQLDYIRRVGCDMVQGYLFCKPVPYDQLPEHEVIG